MLWGGAASAVLALLIAVPAFGAFGFLTWWGPNGSTQDSLGPHIEGIAVDAGGAVYVADLQDDQVKQYTSTGAFVRAWGGSGAGDGEFEAPTGVATAPGAVYVSDAFRVQRFASDGTFAGSWGGEGAGQGRFAGTGGVAVGPDGSVYVTDRGNDRVQRFSATGAFQAAWGGDLSSPLGIAAAPDGTLYVADNGHGRVTHFSPSGATLASWPVGDPHGVAIAADGTVLVADASGKHVARFSPSGNAAGTIGDDGSGGGGGQLNVPRGVAVDCRGSVYVADNSNQRIHKFGEPSLAQPPCPLPVVVAPPPPPPPPGVVVVLAAAEKLEVAPTLGVTALATPVSGKVLVREPGSPTGSAFTLTRKSLIPMGSTVDTTNGRVSLTFATAPADFATLGATETGEFYGGAFTIFQSRSATLAELRLAGQAPSCSTKGSARAAAVTKKKKRFVWGDAKGSYKTTGDYGAATVRGTKWLTEDKCEGTRVKVDRGLVDVRDFQRNKTVKVPAGKEYTALAPCVSRRNFTIRLRPPVGTVVRSVTVLVDGKAVRVTRGSRLTARVDLRGLPKGHVTVRITVVTTAGVRITGTRDYLTCSEPRGTPASPPEL
jgi:hypothetical protein